MTGAHLEGSVGPGMSLRGGHPLSLIMRAALRREITGTVGAADPTAAATDVVTPASSPG